MKILSLFLAAASALALDGVTVGQWNSMLIVSAPAEGNLAQLGSRADQRLTLDARDQPLTDTASFIRRVTGLNVIVTPTLIANPPTITLQVKDMTLGNVLHWIADNNKIHVSYLNNALVFSDKPVTGAPSMRLYDVRDLAMPIPDFPGPEMLVSAASGATTLTTPATITAERPARYDLDALQELIERFVIQPHNNK